VFAPEQAPGGSGEGDDVTCSDYARHERLLDCPHQNGITVMIKLADGCSGRLCTACEEAAGARRWPDITERIAGPARGLDVLEMLRAAARANERPAP
jgi:hypothetical protein